MPVVVTSDKKTRGHAPAPGDIALWKRVTESVEPLDRKRLRTGEDQAKSPPVERTKSARSIVKSAPIGKRGSDRVPVQSPPAVKPASQQPASLDRRTKSRIARGSISIDARLDLHGLRQDEAHRRLRRFLFDAQARGAKFALVITGKGRRDADDAVSEMYAERGVLRRVVPQWLRMPEFRTVVLSVEEAHAAHGGGGAFYVRLKKSTRGSK